MILYFGESSQPITRHHITIQIIHIFVDYQVQLVAGHSLRQATTQSVIITIRCTDGNANYGNLTVVVQPNAPPDIQSLPAAATFIAGTTPKTKIHDLVVVDAEGDLYTCIMTASPSGPFAFEYTGTGININKM